MPFVHVPPPPAHLDAQAEVIAELRAEIAGLHAALDAVRVLAQPTTRLSKTRLRSALGAYY